MMESRKKFKEKRRTNDRRKEKSRDAARCRRSRETDIFLNMAAALPIPQNEVIHLDKASVMRLAIAYLKIRSVANALKKPFTKIESTIETNEFFPQALDGFMLVIASNGDMIYLSENVSDYLGISQLDLIGQSVYDYSHPCDHNEIKEYLLMESSNVDEMCSCNFFIRFKCTLTNKGKKVNLKSASYKVIHCTGRPMISAGDEVNDNNISDDKNLSTLKPQDQSELGSENARVSMGSALVVVGCPIPHPSNIEIPLGRQTFLSKHNLNMRFTYVDERLAEFFGWDNDELIGKSIFEFHHALDNDALDKSFKCLFSKGQCETVAYRFLGRTGGYAWVVTQATVIHCTKRRKPLSIVCVNYILSGIEYGDQVYSIYQLEARNSVNDLKKSQKVKEGNVNTQIILNNNDLSNSIPKVRSPILYHTPKKDSSKSIIISPRCDIGAPKITNKKKNPNPESLFQNKPIIDYNPIRSGNNSSQPVTKKIFGEPSIGNTPDQDTLLSITNRSSPQTATASIFAPRTEDMNKGFLTFSEDQPGLTMLKDEPEDLTHLAPTPGDVCVPLEDTPFLSDMLDEFMLSNENYCTLLSPINPTELPDSNSGFIGDTIKKHDGFGDTLESDPFFYTNPCPNLDASQSNTNSLTQTPTKSPELFSIDLLHGPDSGSIAVESGISEDELLMLNIDEVIADDELVLRAPYIPMSDQDEALQLLISDNMVMWGPTQPPDKSDWDMKRNNSDYCKESSLAKLLKYDKNLNKYDSISAMNSVEEHDQTLNTGINKRSNKRLHEASIITETMNKRMKSQMMEKNTFITSNTAKKSPEIDLFHTIKYTINVDGTNQKNFQINDNNLADTKPNKIRLLQQLIEDHELSNLPATVKSSNLNDVVNRPEQLETTANISDIDGDDENLQEHQSNSVLMNLLISGCDKMYVDLPTLLEEKLRIPFPST